MKPISENDLEQLSAYIDGELSDSERRFFQKRLANDEALRACCERAWIASSVLKSQPFQLMPADSAGLICAQCEPSARRSVLPLRMVASFGALALVAALGYQLLQPADTVQPTLAATPDASPAMVTIGPIQAVADSGKPAVAPGVPDVRVKPVAKQVPSEDAKLLAQDDPAQFELNEATRSKSWPTSSQGMQDYVVRHNEMIGANAGNGLVSYAQILAEPEQGSTAQNDQDKAQDTQ